jgi:thiol-disulfide isomerase/thioredoxin
MRTFLWTCALILFFIPLVSAQDFGELQKTIEANVPMPLPDDLGRKPPAPELVNASKAVVDAATKIYALPDLGDQERRWTLQREAAALIVLAYAEPQAYYFKLAKISDELDERGLSNTKIAKGTEKHVLEIGTILATTAKTGNNAVNIGIEPLAERMLMHVRQNPGQDSMLMIERVLQRIRSMTNPGHRDRRLAVVSPIFRDYYKEINHSAKADALKAEIERATLPEKPMIIMGVDINGNDFDSLSLLDKVVLIQFWGTWCINCKEEMPELINLYEKYHADGFEIIGVKTGVKGDDVRKVKQSIETPLPGGKKIPWIILHEGLAESQNKWSMTKFYGIEELPVLILVGRNGKVKELHPSMSSLDASIAKATSPLESIEWTEEEKKQLEEIERKRNEETDRLIREGLDKP